jgi:transcription antitermination factor NusG
MLPSSFCGTRSRASKRGRKIATSRWLFPRYLFVWIEDQWHRLLNTSGVSKVLMTGDKPVRLPDGWINEIKSRERNGLIILSKHRFKIGQRCFQWDW